MGLKNQRGESLIAVIVAIGVAGVLIAGVTNYMNQMQKGIKTLESRAEVTDLTNEIRNLGGLSPLCRLNFTGRALPPLNMDLIIDRIRFVDAAGTALTNENIVAQGQRLNLGTIVNQIALIPRQQVSPTNYTGTLELRMTHPGAFSPSLVRGIRTIIQVGVGNVISNCSFEDAPVAGGGNLRPCPAASLSDGGTMNVDAPASPSGTTVPTYCSTGATGPGARFLCLDGTWVLTQVSYCQSETPSN